MSSRINSPGITGKSQKLQQTTSGSRITPRNSIADEAIAAAAKETPYDTLRQLASIAPKPSTPLRRASSAGPPSTHRSTRRTPGALDRTPGAVHPGSTRRPNALTPHARAAFRENELRRAAALTPGKDRRRSGRQQRETPRDILRALSRVLAVKSRPTELTPHTGAQPRKQHQIGNDDELYNDADPVRPRLSMPLVEDDEDDSFLLPPQRSLGFADEENITQRSIELPRRALSEQPGGRYSRGSFGSVRTSERFGNLSELGLGALEGEEFDSSFIQQGNFEEEGGLFLNEDPTLPRDAIGDFRRSYMDDDERLSLASGRPSDIRPQRYFGDDTENSFVLTVPQRESLPGRPSIHGLSNLQEDEGENDRAEKQSTTIGAENTVEQEFEGLDSDGDVSMHIPMQAKVEKPGMGRRKGQRAKKSTKRSKYGIEYSSLPPGVVKKLATTFLRTSGNSKAKISKDTLEALMQASDWFFEQISDNLGTYAEHARRKTIDESDVLILMGRQNQTSTMTTPFALAQKYLPRELLQDLRMAQPSKAKRSRPFERVEEEEE